MTGKQVYIEDPGYQYNEASMNHCCGVHEVGGFYFWSPADCWRSKEDCFRLEDLKPSGTGLFIVTITRAPECVAALRVLRRMHTVVAKTKYYKNTYTHADEFGKNSGVSVYVFKFGKEK
jgi:hypothetical protein